jgi:SAM-dependent methyltransferase
MMDTTQPLTADPSNAQQAQAWDGTEGAFWTAQAERLDRTLANCHGPFLTAAAIRDGDHVLDVGCGTGKATRDVARIARRGGAVGVDLSSQMIGLARKTAADEGVDNVEFQQADAQISPFAPETFDAVISRMGSMFFGDPIAAFTNFHCALHPGGRLTLLTWQGLADNEWLTEFRAAAAAGRDLPTPPPDAPGPFSLSDPVRVRTILDAAGFTDITLQDLHAPMSFGPDTDDAFDFVSDMTSWMRGGLDDADRDAALSALRATIDAHTDDHGVTYQCATWIVQARKG